MTKPCSWKVEHVDLLEKIVPLSRGEADRGAYVVFWCAGVPLGHRTVASSSLPMSASRVADLAVSTVAPTAGYYLLGRGFEPPLPGFDRKSAPSPRPDIRDLAALTRPLAKLAAALERETEASGDVTTSVVVCTRDRPDQLVRCLRSLQRQTRPPQEILVVDNAPSSAATHDLVASLGGIHYLREDRPGLDVARNTGIRECRGNLVAFTDDDVTVHDDWIARIQHGFSDPSVMALTGLVLPSQLETEAQWLFEEHWGFNRGYRPKIFDQHFFRQTLTYGAPVWEIGAGANMAFRRTIFGLVGDFDERLDVGAAGCSGDSEMWYRILAAGHVCRYEPRAVVFHHHRRDLEELNRQLFYYMRGHVTALLVQHERHRHCGNLLWLGVGLPHYYLRLVGRGILRGFRDRYSTLGFELAGCLSGLFYYLANRRKTANELGAPEGASRTLER